MACNAKHWCHESVLDLFVCQSDEHPKHCLLRYHLLRDELLAQDIVWWECLSSALPGSEFCENPCFPQWVEIGGQWQCMGQWCQFGLTAVRCHPFRAWGGGGGASTTSWLCWMAALLWTSKWSQRGCSLCKWSTKIIQTYTKVQVVVSTTFALQLLVVENSFCNNMDI